MAAPRASRALVVAVLAIASLAAAWIGGVAFLPAPAPTRTAAAAELRSPLAMAAGLIVPAAAGVLPAVAGEPPSVGEHWYWNLGFGSLHGETASIILLVFFLLVVFSLLGAGGSSKKSSA
mmetsp:Transcript_1761/g.5547  ORF Transcript_1761/g.5547 Transcript_1761/m.5547 type:complete len:120 (+) Transcript_1761:81-440(+)